MQVVDGSAVVGTGDRHAVGGAVLDDLLEMCILKQGVPVPPQDLQTLKEKFAMVAESREEYLEVSDEKKEVDSLEHTLPDGQVVKIGKERCTPCLFRLLSHFLVHELDRSQ